MRLSLLLIFACRGEDPKSDPHWADVDVALDPFSLSYGDAEIPAGGLALGVESSYAPNTNHDPYNLYVDDFEDGYPAVVWETAETAVWVDDETLRLSLSGGHSALLTRDAGVDDGLALHLALEDVGETEPAEGALAASVARVSFTSPAGEGLYGTGERFDAVDQRGRVSAMQFEIDLEQESGYNEAHVPVPFLVASGGWGAGALSDWPAVWDAASTDEGLATLWVASPVGLDLRLYTGEPVEIAAAWARAAGLPRTPPDWALAPMLWRDENTGQDEVLSDAAAIRDNDLAFGVMWIDNPWQTTYNSMQPDAGMFPDWDGMVDTLHAQGMRWLAWTTPYLEEDDPEFSAYEDAGLFVDLVLAFNGFGELIDLSGEAGQDAWQERVSAAADRGLQGWKLDYGEDIQVGLGTGRLKVEFANGQDERTMHHRFVADYHRAYSEPYEDREGGRFLLGRTGTWGTAAVTDCVWPGDLDSGWQAHREDGHVGGLQAAVRGGVSLSVSGFPCYASDTGGYRHDRPDSELMIRWTEYSALVPVMQVGGSGAEHNYWIFDGDWDEATLSAGQRYTILHTRLFPYFQALLAETAELGTPPALPLGMVGGPVLGDVDEALHTALDTAYVLGGKLLVAPVIEPGATTREVLFPPGTWVHWWTGESYADQAEVPAPLGEGPLFLGEGAIVPLLRESVRTLAPSTAGVESWADDPGVLTLRVVPGEGGFVVQDGPTLTVSADELEIGALGIYSGVRVEVWAPDATGLTLDGAAVAATPDGPWWTAEVASGTVAWER